MHEFLMDLCMFSPEECQLLKDNMQLYVNIAGIAVVLHIGIMIIPEFIYNLIRLIIKKYFVKGKAYQKDNDKE